MSNDRPPVVPIVRANADLRSILRDLPPEARLGMAADLHLCPGCLDDADHAGPCVSSRSRAFHEEARGGSDD